MELAHLRALRALGDRGSIAAVAASLRVTPSSVSQQIAALQRTTRIPLTEKVGRRTTLTAAGRALADAVAEVEVALEKANEAVERFHEEATGEVTVAAFTSAALAVFGPLLEATAGTAVGVSVSDHDVRQDAFPGLVLDHDLVIAHRLRNSAPWPETVAVVPLLEEPLDVAMRPGHPLAQFSSLSADRLREAEWVAVHDGFPLEGAIETLSTVAGIDARVRHRVNDFVVAAAVVAATDCVALIPRHLGADALSPGVVLRPTEGFSIARHIDVLARPEALHRRTVQRVLSELRPLFARP
ncbi:LysR family transcriptional regulator [Frondihabitans cladoniiphilus]|uniref:LysR family transcriptional regulator n=1 Tax=Frondihabitans cladoniiphilus TaxID=715785 RepID=A0ABP8VHM7_9MICO